MSTFAKSSRNQNHSLFGNFGSSHFKKSRSLKIIVSVLFCHKTEIIASFSVCNHIGVVFQHRNFPNSILLVRYKFVYGKPVHKSFHRIWLGGILNTSPCVPSLSNFCNRFWFRWNLACHRYVICLCCYFTEFHTTADHYARNLCENMRELELIWLLLFFFWFV